MKNEKRENFFLQDDSFGFLWYNSFKILGGREYVPKIPQS